MRSRILLLLSIHAALARPSRVGVWAFIRVTTYHTIPKTGPRENTGSDVSRFAKKL